MDVTLLRSSFDTVRPIADEAAKAFYSTLLNTYPQVRPLFANTDFDSQRTNLMQSLAAIVTLVDKPDEMGALLTKLGHTHKGYNVTPEMYEFVSASLLGTLAGALGNDWTPETASTWVDALHAVSAAMIEAQNSAAT
ncbi:MAG: globin domain-containing protein [Planctomycetota bacterium]|nr:globin domain-containing protein [Planctomycetota bacterium]